MVWIRKMVSVVTLVLFISSLASTGSAKVLHEGWYKIIVGGVHSGFLVQRYEFDPSQKKYTGTYFIKISVLGGNSTESLKAEANDKLAPIAYQYTSKTDKETKTIDAVFKMGAMTADMVVNGKQTKITNKLEKGVFLSTFLVYLMMQNKNGLKVGNNYQYKAIAEEDGIITDGESYISGTEKQGDKEYFKVLNTFKKAKFVSLLDMTGNIILTRSPVDSLETRLSPRAEAVGNYELNEKSLKLLFGDVPSDKETPTGLATATTPVKAKEPRVTSTTLKSDIPKGISVPPGKGLPQQNEVELKPPPGNTKTLPPKTENETAEPTPTPAQSE